MSRILCLDASTEACSVGLWNHGQITEKYQVAPRQHANLLLPMVNSLLADSQISLQQLDAIACLVGPGAFTGIRIAVSAAQGLAFGANLPTIALSSLENLAQQAFDESDCSFCWSAIDARMHEVYLGGFQRCAAGLARPIIDERVIAPEKIDFETLNKFSGGELVAKIGSGWQAYQNEFEPIVLQHEHLFCERFPKAATSLKLANLLLEEKQLLAPEELQPVYLRNKVAEKKTV